jgi:hypothetical protein
MTATLQEAQFAHKRFEFPGEDNGPQISLDEFLRQMEWVAKTKSIPPQVASAIAATVWLMSVDAFRQNEASFMASGVYEQKLDQHRLKLARIIRDGEEVVFMVSKQGMIETPSKFTLEDLQATLESLYVTFRGEYGPKNSPGTNAIIQGLFDGKKPKD